jgi:pimeloyl-ACP methyl ester carboxylesterase
VELAKLSSNSRMLVADMSGHAIQMEQPDIVVDTIRDMVETFRRGSPSAT